MRTKSSKKILDTISKKFEYKRKAVATALVASTWLVSLGTGMGIERIIDYNKPKSEEYQTINALINQNSKKTDEIALKKLIENPKVVYAFPDEIKSLSNLERLILKTPENKNNRKLTESLKNIESTKDYAIVPSDNGKSRYIEIKNSLETENMYLFGSNVVVDREKGKLFVANEKNKTSGSISDVTSTIELNQDVYFAKGKEVFKVNSSGSIQHIYSSKDLTGIQQFFNSGENECRVKKIIGTDSGVIIDGNKIAQVINFDTKNSELNQLLERFGSEEVSKKSKFIFDGKSLYVYNKNEFTPDEIQIINRSDSYTLNQLVIDHFAVLDYDNDGKNEVAIYASYFSLSKIYRIYKGKNKVSSVTASKTPDFDNVDNSKLEVLLNPDKLKKDCYSKLGGK